MAISISQIINAHSREYGKGKMAPVLIRAAMPRLLAEDPLTRDEDLRALAAATGYSDEDLLGVLRRWQESESLRSQENAEGNVKPPRWRPTTYNGIQMRSRLEATVAGNLDRVGIPWTYEPNAFAAPGMRQWLPDFRLSLRGGRVAYVEVKGSLRGIEADGGRVAVRRRLMARMGVAWESEPDALLVIAEDEITESRPTAGAVWAGDRRLGWAHALFVVCCCQEATTSPGGCTDADLVPLRGSAAASLPTPAWRAPYIFKRST